MGPVDVVPSISVHAIYLIVRFGCSLEHLKLCKFPAQHVADWIEVMLSDVRERDRKTEKEREAYRQRQTERQIEREICFTSRCSNSESRVAAYSVLVELANEHVDNLAHISRELIRNAPSSEPGELASEWGGKCLSVL